MNYTDFGMDTASLAGSLEAKLAAVRHAGFAQVMVSATDVVGHPRGVAAAARAIRDSRLRVTGYEALRFREVQRYRVRAVVHGDFVAEVAPALHAVERLVGGS